MLPGNKITNILFYGNYFYGLCAVGLAIEAGLQQHYPLNHPLLYVILFCSTIVYYTIPYREEKEGLIVNSRSLWYKRNVQLVKYTQLLFSAIAVVCIGIYTQKYWQEILQLGIIEWLLLFTFPLMGVMYYGIDNKSNLRKIGLLKPFIIGFIWAGLVTTYPIIFSRIENHINPPFEWMNFWLFVKNTMYVGVLCIMFDIKDYADDHRQKLNTIIVKTGLRKTLFYVLLPLIIMGLIAFIYYGVAHQFHIGKIVLNSIPFVLLLWVAYSLRIRRNILYYLVVVDGLMLVKAICGSLAMLYF